MSFIANNPISSTKLKQAPPTPSKGVRGLFPTEEGWHDINNDGSVKKILDETFIDQHYDAESTNAQSGNAVSEAIDSLKEKPGITTADGGEIFNDYENNKAISNKTTASGINTLAGCKGFYWYDIDFSTSNPVITLTEKRLSPPSSEISTEYAVGDVISIVNDAKYIDCSTITAIGDTTITVDALPFTEVVDMSSDLGFDDYTLFVLKKPTLGQVDLGIGANASGNSNKALGAYSNVKGKDNTGKGQYSDIGGRNNEGGYCAHIGGRENKGGVYDLIGGYKNYSDGGANGIVGVGNKVTNDGAGNLVSGRDNSLDTKHTVVGGAENVSEKRNNFGALFGRGHIATEEGQVFMGTFSANDPAIMFGVGTGGSDSNRRNAFEVHKDGRATIGAEPVNDMDVVNKGYVEPYFNRIDNCISDVEIQEASLSSLKRSVDNLNSQNGEGTGSLCLPNNTSTKGAYTFTSGFENVNDGQNSLVSGRNNTNNSKNTVIGGA